MLDTRRELFEHQLRANYDAEKKLDRALETMSKNVSDATLSDSFKDHRVTTKEQAKRLEQVFSLVDKKPRREPCRGINGLINEFTEFIKKEQPSDDLVDAFAIEAALKVERYEIVAYRSLIRVARQLALPEAVELFTRNLAEEEEAARNLEALADQLTGTLPPSAQRPKELVIETEATEGEVVLPDRADSVVRSEPLL